MGAWSAPDTTSHCFIGGQCIAEGAHGKMPDGTTDRYGRPKMVDDPCSKCIPSVSGTAYSPVVEKGCMLDMASFAAACYDDKGAVTMNETAKLQLMADKTRMTTTLATRDATIVKMQAEKTTMQADKTKILTEKAGMTTTLATRDATIVKMQADKTTMQAEKTKILTEKAALQSTVDSCDKDDGFNKTVAIALIVIMGVMFVLVLLILGVLISKERSGAPVFMTLKNTGPAKA